jgi:SAM-dependent methyltransferase
MGTGQHFTDSYLAAKHNFVEEVLAEIRPDWVLDIGCNTGYFSKLAAAAGSRVVAVDLDETSVARLWKEAHTGDFDILPLVVNVTRPSPATGWLNSECSSFISRINKRMDLVIMLAVVHHMIVTERVPLEEILNLMAETTTNKLIIEYVPPSDPMFRQIARGRDELYSYFTQDYFESVCRRHFKIEKCLNLADSDRRLYLLAR